MFRDVEPRSVERDRPEPGRGRVGGSADVESVSHSGDPRDVFTRDLELPRGSTRERVRANGRIYRMAPQGNRHMVAISKLAEVLPRSATDWK